MMDDVSLGAMILLVLCVPVELAIAAVSVLNDSHHLKSMMLVLLFAIACGFISLIASIVADAMRDAE